jgi:hypothetical protein
MKSGGNENRAAKLFRARGDIQGVKILLRKPAGWWRD